MKHYVLVLTILLAATAAHYSIEMSQASAIERSVTDYAFEMPTRIGQYTQYGDDLEVDERTKEVLQTSNILMRNYVGPHGWPVQLSIVHAGATRRSLHFPEVCIVGAGWEVREQNTVPVGILFEARQLVLVKGDQREAVLYWFKTGDKLTGNFFLNAFNWVQNQVTMGDSTSAMIRVSTFVGPQGEEAAFEVLRDFAAQVTPVVLDNVP